MIRSWSPPTTAPRRRWTARAAPAAPSAISPAALTARSSPSRTPNPATACLAAWRDWCAREGRHELPAASARRIAKRGDGQEPPAIRPGARPRRPGAGQARGPQERPDRSPLTAHRDRSPDGADLPHPRPEPAAPGGRYPAGLGARPTTPAQLVGCGKRRPPFNPLPLPFPFVPRGLASQALVQGEERMKVVRPEAGLSTASWYPLPGFHGRGDFHADFRNGTINRMQASARLWRHFDVWLLAAVVVLTIAGIAMIRSAIAGNENLSETVPRQSIYAVIGMAVVLVTAAVDYRIWSAIARPLYVVAVLLLGMVLLAGSVSFNAVRWFNLGIATVQPSEVTKVIMILVLADYFSRHEYEIGRWGVILRSLALVSLPAVLLFLQPDLSAVIDLAIIWITIIWAAGVPLRRLAAMAGVALLMVVILWPLLAGYQQARVASFLFPDPEAQFGETYNVLQARIAIGSGGLFGQGYGHGTQVQLRFLKARHTDFIFSAMSQEIGKPN